MNTGTFTSEEMQTHFYFVTLDLICKNTINKYKTED